MDDDLVAVSRRLEELLGVPPLVRVNGKAPLDRSWTTGPRTQPAAWRQKLAKHEGNVGLLTGHGLFVVDVDLHVVGAEDSIDELHALGLPRQTVTTITPRGGRHLYFRTLATVPSRPLEGFVGIDVKGELGQVVVPPSAGYEYEFSWGPGDCEVAQLPEELEDLFATSPARPSSSRGLDERDEEAVNLLLRLGGHSPIVRQGYVLVTRPGKESGGSATVGRLGRGVVKVFSSAWDGLPAGVYDLTALRRVAGVEGPKVRIPDAEVGGIFVLSSTLSTREQRWLWEDRLPLGEFTIVGGQEKLGKSTALVWVAARLSRGELPGDFDGKPANVLFLSAEDDAERVLIPRLVAAGADRTRVWVSNPKNPGFSIPAIAELDVRLVVLDPFSIFVNVPASNEHGEIGVRKAIYPFVELAAEHNLVVCGIRHLRKSPSGANPFDALMGSRGFTAAARSVLFFTPDREHKDRAGGLVFTKGNLATGSGGIRYRLDSTDVALDDGTTGNVPLFVIEEGGVSINLEDALGSEERLTARQEAIAWLIELLTPGRLEADTVRAMANRDEIAWRTLNRYKPDAGVHSVREGGVWYWVLGEDCQRRQDDSGEK